MSDQTPAGWYPAEQGRIRWWDGNGWTEHYLEQQPAAPAAEAVAPEAAATVEPVVEAAPAADAVGEVVSDVAPAVEVPAVETPVVETPSFETPSFETPSFETPAVDVPVAESPSFEAPPVAAPAAEVPPVEIPAVETPVFEAPAAPAPAFVPPVAAPPAAPPPAVPPAAAPPAQQWPPAVPPQQPYGAPAAQQPYGTPPAQQPYGAAPTQPYGVAPVPQQPYGGAPVAQQSPYGAAPVVSGVPPVPTPGGAPAYAYPAAPRKKSLAWLWILLGVIALLLVVGAIVIFAVVVPALVSSPRPDVPVVTTAPIDPSPDSGSLTNGQKGMLSDFRDEFPEYGTVSDGQVLQLGDQACQIATAKSPVTMQDVVDFGTATMQAIDGAAFGSATGDDKYTMVFNGSVVGEIGVYHLCNDEYQNWWDAVEELSQAGRLP